MCKENNTTHPSALHHSEQRSLVERTAYTEIERHKRPTCSLSYQAEVLGEARGIEETSDKKTYCSRIEEKERQKTSCSRSYLAEVLGEARSVYQKGRQKGSITLEQTGQKSLARHAAHGKRASKKRPIAFDQTRRRGKSDKRDPLLSIIPGRAP